MTDREEYLCECMQRGEIPQAIAFLRHKADRYRLSKIPDPSSARRKAPEYTGDELTLFEYAVEAFLKREMQSGSPLDILIKDAFVKNDQRTFKIIQDARDYAQTPMQIKHGKNVIAAIEAIIEILEIKKEFPTKFEIKETVLLKLGDQSFDKSDTSWSKVFRDAGLKFLPKDKPWAEQRGGKS